MKMKSWVFTAMVVAAPIVGLPGVAMADSSSTAATSTSASVSKGLFVNGDTVSSESGCVMASSYARGTTMVIRARVYNADGSINTDAKVTVKMADGTELPMAYGMHPPGAPASKQSGYYVAAYHIANNAPLGPDSYTITATDSSTGATGTFQPIPMPPSLPMIVPGNYQVTTSAKVNGASVSSVSAGETVNISAMVDSTVVGANHKPTQVPLAKGTVTAELGVAGNVDKKGKLVATTTAKLAYDSATKTWDGTITVPANAASGLWTLQVNAADIVTPAPNVGESDTTLSVGSSSVTIVSGKKTYGPLPVVNEGMTTYIPLWYAEEALSVAGVKNTWNGATWSLTSSHALKEKAYAFGKSGGKEIVLNGTAVAKINTVVAKAPFSHVETTYVPLQVAEQVFKAAGLSTSWEGSTLTL